MLLIKNAHIIPFPGNQVDLLIAEGKIVQIGQDLEIKITDSDKTIDASGLLVGPGLVCTHSHFREPGQVMAEDIQSGAKAAARGGYTSIVMMGNTSPCVDNVETLNYVLDKGSQTPLNIYSVANVTNGMAGAELTDMRALAKAGAVAFSDDGIPVLDEKLLSQAMTMAKKLEKPLALHEEDPAFIAENGINKGRVAKELGLDGADRLAEISMVCRDIEIAKQTKATVVFQHLSTKEAVAIIRRHLEEERENLCLGADGLQRYVHAEVTPHHFTLTEEAVLKHGSLAKMNPPLRTKEDRTALISGLCDGTIDIIATDHAPHVAEAKAKPFVNAPSGIIGLELALSLALRSLVEPGFLTYDELFLRMSTTPAKVYGLPAGEIAVGASADLVLFSPHESWKVGEFHSKSTNSPFTAETLPGVIKWTICRGEIVYENA